MERRQFTREFNRLASLGDQAELAETSAFTAFLAPLRKAEWVVYAKEPFGGPQAVLAYRATPIASPSPIAG
jgi:hypothetical protein